MCCYRLTWAEPRNIMFSNILGEALRRALVLGADVIKHPHVDLGAV
jgi:hypothetical protein